MPWSCRNSATFKAVFSARSGVLLVESSRMCEPSGYSHSSPTSFSAISDRD